MDITEKNKRADIGIVIVSYNVRELLHQCLLSIEKAAAGMTVTVIVVDNASVDGTAEFLTREFPQIRLIANRDNRGFGAANNQALKELDSEYLLFLNPDTIVSEDTLKVMKRYLDENSEAGMAGCRILNSDGSLQLACRRSFPTPAVTLPKMLGLSALFPKSRLFARYNLTFLDPDKSYAVDAISGSFMFSRTELIRKMGGFDERFFMYGEDLDLCYRINELGKEVHYVAETTIVHYKGESSKQAVFDNILIFYRAMDIFVRKHFRLRHSFLFTFILRLGIIAHLILRFSTKIMRVFRNPIFDGLLLYVSFISALLLRFGDLDLFPNYIFITALYFALYLIAASSLGLYRSRPHDFVRSTAALLLGGILSGFITFFLPQIAHSRIAFLIGFGISLILIPGWRLLQKLSRRQRFGSHRDEQKAVRTAVIGSDTEAERIADILSHRPDLGYLFIGFIDENFSDPRTIGRTGDLREIIQLKRLNCLIFSSASSRQLMPLMHNTRDLEIDYKIVPENLNMIYGKAAIETLDEGLSMVEMEYKLHKGFNRGLKRAFDVILSILLILLFSIPALFIRVFSSLEKKCLTEDDRRWCWWERKKGGQGKLWWYPLLFSIFRGNLSFVGDLWKIPEGSRRFYKPGWCGLMQIEKNSSEKADGHSRYMSFYMRNYSFSMDIEILLKTLFNLQ